jgi:RimJ/RimL family protein N-acetyltransferase
MRMHSIYSRFVAAANIRENPIFNPLSNCCRTFLASYHQGKHICPDSGGNTPFAMKKNSCSMDFSLRRRAGCPRYGQMRLPWSYHSTVGRVIPSKAGCRYARWMVTVETLITPRLRLRAFTEADRRALLAVQGDADVMRLYGNGEPLSAAQVDLVLAAHIHCREKFYWAWAVCLRDETRWGENGGGCFGQITAIPTDWGGEPWVELCWLLLPAWWKNGYATEAVKAVIAHGTKELGWRKLMAGSDVDNAASLRVMTKNGMTFARDEKDERGRMRRICTLVVR